MIEGKQFHIFTIGWDPPLIGRLWSPMEAELGIKFTHGLLWGDDAVFDGDARFLRIGLKIGEPLPPPDYALLASLECEGVHSIRTMILGDRVLRNRSEVEALGYMTLVARRMREALTIHSPDLVVGAFDQAHGMLGLAVAKSLNIPWVTMAFSVIPENLVGFCKRLTPNSLIPGLARPIDASIRSQAREVMDRFRSRKMRVFVFRPATSLVERLAHMRVHLKNLARRLVLRTEYNKFVFPTMTERVSDIVRRNFNALTLPTGHFLKAPEDKRYVFFPLQMKPEMSTDTQAPFYQDQIALVRQLVDAIPIDVDFVVKLHLSDPDNYSRVLLSRLMAIPGIRIAHPSAPSFKFLEQAALVVGITGTPCLEAALLGKPVLIFGDSPYVNFPRSERAGAPDEYPRQIRKLLQSTTPDEQEIVDAFSKYIARYKFGRINDWERRIENDEFERLCSCFRELRAFLEQASNRTDWYSTYPFAPITDGLTRPQ